MKLVYVLVVLPLLLFTLWMLMGDPMPVYASGYTTMIVAEAPRDDQRMVENKTGVPYAGVGEYQ